MDIAVGQKATRTLTLTATHVKTFAELTRDHNSLHAEVLSIHPTKPVTQLKLGGANRKSCWVCSAHLRLDKVTLAFERS
jgi:hypothetical protein